MSHVSTSVTRWLLDWLEGHSISARSWTKGICDVDAVVGDDGSIPWTTFAALCERLAEFSEHPPEGALAIPTLVDVGREVAEEVYTAGDGSLGAGELPIELVLVERVPAFAQSLAPDLDIQADMASDGEVILYQINLPESGEECPALFSLIEGALEAVPLAAGLEAADIAMDIQSGGARIAMRVPDVFENVLPFDTSPLDRAPYTDRDADDDDFDREIERYGAVADEPGDGDEALSISDWSGPSREPDGSDEPWGPHATVARPDESSAFIQQIASAAKLDGVVDTLFASLRADLGCRAARLTVANREEPFQFGRLGRTSKPPVHQFPLHAAGQAVARLEVWRKAALDDTDLLCLEERLPIVGLAILALGEAESSRDAAASPTAEQAPSPIVRPLLDSRLIEAGDPLGAVASTLCRVAGAHTAAISVRTAQRPMQLRTLVCWQADGRVAGFEYGATGTPCAEVLSGQTVQIDRDAQTSFPALAHFAIRGTNAYVGTPLRDREGNVIGVLSMWRREPIADCNTERSSVRLLADRAEVELIRLGLERDAERAAHRLEQQWAVTHDIAIEWDAEHNRARVSPNVKEVLGYDPDHFVSLGARDVIHPDDLAGLEADFKRGLASDDVIETTIRLIDAKRVPRPFSLRMKLGFDEEVGTRASISLRDLSAEEGLLHERDRLVSIVENSSDLIALFSLQGGVLSMNEAGQRMLGLASEEEARSRTIHDFTHDDSARSMKFEIIPTVHRRSQWDGDIDLRHAKTDATIRVESRLFTITDRATLQPLAIAMIARDTTAVRERDRALLESEERYRMLADNPYELIAELDVAGRFIYASGNFEPMLGRTPESLLGRVANEFVHREDRKKLFDYFQGLTPAGGSSQFEFRLQHEDGHYRWLEATFRTYMNAGGRTTTVAIARDITDRVESSEALRQTQHKLQQSQKMEAIGRMAGGVAHDFNNLLTAITGYCDLLLEDLGEQHPARLDAEEILKASERAAGLTHQLLAFSRRQVLQPRIVDMNNLVADLDRMLRRLIGEGIELVTVLDGTAWPTKADPGQLHQVLLNLVVNARDAMPRGGRITIETANEQVEQPIRTEFDEIPAGDYVKLSVRDTGTGMTPEIQSMIFEPFFTTKDSGKGTGLGLSTVIGIVQQTGGHIGLESQVGRGTTFHIYLPRTEGVAMLPEHNETPDQFDGSETVMVVEDSEPVRNLVVRCLERHGYSVLQASSSAEALKLSNRHEGPIALFLCDVILPRMDGIELGKRVKSVRPDSGVLFMSGFTDDGLAKHGVDAAEVALLEKPFTPSTLLRTVREFLDDGTIPVPPTRSLPEDDQVR